MTEEDITQDPEYIRGYKEFHEAHERVVEDRKSPYRIGWNAASNECYKENITMEQLNERLQKLERYLEKYTQE